MGEKKPYVSPEMEITVFDTEDVITTSNGEGKQDNNEPNW
jgi:hypothetical protein